MGKGIFITMEGVDGSGKSTQIGLLKEYLQSKGYDVVLTREPGGTEISEKIRTLTLDKANSKMGSITEMLLYAAARAQLVHERIRPSLKEGRVVICDRFVDSSYVYQGFGRGIDLNKVVGTNEIALEGLMPDITFFFDIRPEAALARRMAASQADRIESEKLEFHIKVYEGYRKLAEMYPERIKPIDCSRTVEEIFSDIRRWVDRFLEL